MANVYYLSISPGYQNQMQTVPDGKERERFKGFSVSGFVVVWVPLCSKQLFSKCHK